MDERMEEGIERVMEDGKDKEWKWEGRSDGGEDNLLWNQG